LFVSPCQIQSGGALCIKLWLFDAQGKGLLLWAFFITLNNLYPSCDGWIDSLVLSEQPYFKQPNQESFFIYKYNSYPKALKPSQIINHKATWRHLWIYIKA